MSSAFEKTSNGFGRKKEQTELSFYAHKWSPWTPLHQTFCAVWTNMQYIKSEYKKNLHFSVSACLEDPEKENSSIGLLEQHLN